MLNSKAKYRTHFTQVSILFMRLIANFHIRGITINKIFYIDCCNDYKWKSTLRSSTSC